MKSSAMALTVTLLLVTLVSHSWSAPQWKNWTPQAILYLKGAQRHRSVLERAGREEGDTLHLVTHSRSSDGLGMSLAASILLELLRQAMEEGGDNPGYLHYQNERGLNLNYL